MSNQLKVILLALFLVQIGIFFWSRNTQQQEKKSEVEAIIRAYLEIDNPNEMLSLSDMELTEIPDLILECQELTSLNLSHNHFEEIPPIVFQLPNLKYLNVTYNELENIRFEENSSIQYLDLGHNKIKSIENQNALKKLSSLVLEYNQLDYCPNFNHDIYSLNLSYNQIELFSSFSNNDFKINHLDISNNLFANTNQFGKLPKRCLSLNLSNNFDYGNRFPTQLLTDGSTIKNLYLNNCSIKYDGTIPENQLEILELDYNEFAIENLDSFSNLKELSLKGIQTESLNLSSTTISKLKLVDIIIKGSVTLDLPNLETLHISNSLNVLKSELKLPKLIEVYYYGDSGVSISQLRQKYPNVQFIKVAETN